MKLHKARVQNYRSVIDTGLFEIEDLKTILVGPNEAGKTVILKALQQLNKPADIAGFDVLRDYPRSLYNDISTKKILPENVTVVTGYFTLDEDDTKLLPEEFKKCSYKLLGKIDNNACHSLENAPLKIYFKDIKNDLARLIVHIDKQYVLANPEETTKNPNIDLKAITETWIDSTLISDENATKLKTQLEKYYTLIEEGNEKEESRYDKLIKQIEFNKKFDEVLDILHKRTPVFILFNNYFKVKPSVHLEHLAQRSAKNLLDDEYYDYGNLCLLKLLGFTARQLADLGNTVSPSSTDKVALKDYKDKLDSRSYQLNAASVRLSREIRTVWMPNPERPEADKSADL